MVDLSGGPEGPIEHRFSNWIFVGPAIITIALVVMSLQSFFLFMLTLTVLVVVIGFFAYKLIQAQIEKTKKKEEKKKLKQQKKETLPAKKKK